MAISKEDRQLNKKDLKLFLTSETRSGIVIKPGFTGKLSFVKNEKNEVFNSMSVVYKGNSGTKHIGGFAMNKIIVLDKKSLKDVKNLVINGNEVENVYKLEDIQAIPKTALMQELLHDNQHIMPATMNIIGAGILTDDEGNPRHSLGRQYKGYNAWAKTVRDADGIPMLDDFIDFLKKEGRELEERSGFNADNTQSMTATLMVADDADFE